MTDDVTTGRSARLVAGLVIRLRWLIVFAWLAGVAAATIFLPSLSEAGSTPLGGLVPEDAKSLETRERSLELFVAPIISEIAIVQRDPEGLSADAQARVIERAVRIREAPEPGLEKIAFALPVTNTAKLFPGSRENSTTAITFLFYAPDTGIGDANDLAHELVRRDVNRPDDAFVGVTGALPARLAEFDRIEDSLIWVELATVALIAAILGFTFRSVGAPLVALVSAGVAFLVAIRVIAWVGAQMGIGIPREVEPLLIVLLLGIVTDYAIFLLAGTRRRLAAGEGRVDAARNATAQYLPIIVTAGLIVAAGTLALLAGVLDFFRAFGPGLALSALVGLAVSITLIPALLAVLGRLVFWPKLQAASADVETDEPAQQTLAGWQVRLAHLASARPAAALIVLLSAGALVVAATGLREMNLGFSHIRGLPADAEPKRAFEAAAKGFAPGVIAPTEIVVEGPRIANRRNALVRLEELIEDEPGVAGIVGPREAPADIVEGAIVSESGNAARYAVFLDEAPLGGKAIEDLRTLEKRAPELAREAGFEHASVAFAGDTALARETVDTTISDLKKIGLIALGVNLLLLVIFLRSLVAPLFLLVASVLALGATLGITTYLFQGFLGHDDVTYYVPFAAAVLLVSLGSDYNVFVVGKIWEEAQKRPLREAMAIAVPRASKAISVAGLALAFSFALLAIVPLRAFRELGFALCVGVLVDAFVVRSMLVPALISLFGDVSWWPGRRRVRFRRPRLTRTRPAGR